MGAALPTPILALSPVHDREGALLLPDCRAEGTAETTLPPDACPVTLDDGPTVAELWAQFAPALGLPM